MEGCSGMGGLQPMIINCMIFHVDLTRTFYCPGKANAKPEDQPEIYRLLSLLEDKLNQAPHPGLSQHLKAQVCTGNELFTGNDLFTILVFHHLNFRASEKLSHLIPHNPILPGRPTKWPESRAPIRVIPCEG